MRSNTTFSLCLLVGIAANVNVNASTTTVERKRVRRGEQLQQLIQIEDVESNAHKESRLLKEDKQNKNDSLDWNNVMRELQMLMSMSMSMPVPENPIEPVPENPIEPVPEPLPESEEATRSFNQSPTTNLSPQTGNGLAPGEEATATADKVHAQTTNKETETKATTATADMDPAVSHKGWMLSLLGAMVASWFMMA